MSRRFPNSIYSLVDKPKKQYRRRGNPNADFGDRPGDDGRRHYRQYHPARPITATVSTETQRTTMLPEKPPEAFTLPDPPLEHRYVVLWLKNPLTDDSVRHAQNHLKRKMYLLDTTHRLFLIENISKEEFPRLHFPNNRYVCHEYRVADLPFDRIPEPYTP